MPLTATKYLRQILKVFELTFCNSTFHHGRQTCSSFMGRFWTGAICGQLLEGVKGWETAWWDTSCCAIWWWDCGAIRWWDTGEGVHGLEQLSRDTVLDGVDLLLDGDTEARPGWCCDDAVEQICDAGSSKVTSEPTTLPGTIWMVPKNWGTNWVLMIGKCCIPCGAPAPGSDVIWVAAGIPTWSCWLAGEPWFCGCGWWVSVICAVLWRQFWRCISSLPRVSGCSPSTWLRYLVTSWAHSLNPALYLPTTVLSAAAAMTSCWRWTFFKCLTVISKMSAFSNLEYCEVWNDRKNSNIKYFSIEREHYALRHHLKFFNN